MVADLWRAIVCRAFHSATESLWEVEDVRPNLTRRALVDFRCGDCGRPLPRRKAFS